MGALDVSTHAMLDRILEQTPAIMAVVTDPELAKSASSTLKNYVFTFEESSLVQKLVDILKPFLMATQSVCADKTPTMHKIIPIVKKLQQCVAIVSAQTQEDPPPIKKIKDKMMSEIVKRTTDTNFPYLACCLNPFTKNLEFMEPSERIKAHSHLTEMALTHKVDIKIKKDYLKMIIQLNLIQLYQTYQPCQILM